MKTSWLRPKNRRSQAGFTLIELLVVISIIAILAAIMLPVLARVKIKAQIKQAQMEITQIKSAINAYEATYSRFPVSQDAVNAASKASGGPDDFTYGTAELTCYGSSYNKGFKTPTPGQYEVVGNSKYQTNNSELVAILMDLETYRNGRSTINKGHVKNPQRSILLNAKSANDNTSPGVGLDGVYRDPWGNPYIVSIDLNNDEKTRDGYYRKSNVSQLNGQAGINGLFNSETPNGISDYFEYKGDVMVWSAGPDRMIEYSDGGNPNAKANKGANKDNITSWSSQ